MMDQEGILEEAVYQFMLRAKKEMSVSAEAYARFKQACTQAAMQ